MADPLIVCTHAQTPETILAPKVIGRDDLKRCEELGAAMAVGMSIGSVLEARLRPWRPRQPQK